MNTYTLAQLMCSTYPASAEFVTRADHDDAMTKAGSLYDALARLNSELTARIDDLEHALAKAGA